MDQIKNLANELSKSLLAQNQTPQVYIASPFFDEASCAWVSAKEKEFEGFGIPFFSPRQDGINFNEKGLTRELRSERIRAIFKNNVRRLKQCKDICCNLTPCKGRLDIGTLWELGYFVGCHGNPFDKGTVAEYSSLAVSEDLRDLILTICKNLENIRVQEGLKYDSTRLFYRNASPQRIEKSIKLANLKFEGTELSSTLQSIELGKKDSYTFLVDELPFQLFILMGYMYAKGIPYTTASFKGYGSNVMIAASSEGHINLPGLVDHTYSDDLQ